MSEPLNLGDGWRSEQHRHADSVCVMYKHDKKPILLRIDEIDNFDKHCFRVSMKVSRDHDEHAHETLYETPILNVREDAEAFCKAIAKAPMRYARNFFKLGKVKK